MLVAQVLVLCGQLDQRFTTVAPFTCTVSCFPVYCRRGVGIKILGINQLFLFRRRLLRIGQPAIGVVELPLLNG